MNKSDLRPQLGITLNSFDEFVLNREGGFVNAALSIYHTLDDYNDDLTHKKHAHFDIIAIYDHAEVNTDKDRWYIKTGKLIWERK